MVELFATVAPSNMQVLPDGDTLIGESPAEQATPSDCHEPSAHRYCVPDWQLAAPVEKEMPSYWQLFESVTFSDLQEVLLAFHSPSAQRYSMPAWHEEDPGENIVPL